MAYQVLIAHAKGEEEFAEQLAGPIREAGYEVAHQGTVMVGESVVEEASKILSAGNPVVLCGTVRAVGTKWGRQVVNAARMHSGVRIFAVQMEEEADVESLTFDARIARYWQDSAKAKQELIGALRKYYPLDVIPLRTLLSSDAERRYRDLALKSCDIIDLANLPESDRHIATRELELRRLYVALRVRVEALKGTEADESILEVLEKRRDALQKQPWNRIGGGEREDKPERVSIGERLAKARRLVVLGDPGAGKTTLIRWIATAYLLRLKQDPDWKELPDIATLPDQDWLPVIIRCRELDPSCVNGSLDDILRFTLRKAEMTDAEATAFQNVVREKLHQGQALLLLDGLDEIKDPGSRARFCRQIEQIYVAYPEAPIIATSRIVGYREMGYRIGRGFEHITVAELSREDKDDFARRWCALTELSERRETATAELIHDIHSTDRIERLTGNPMLLTTMALVKRKVGRLPNRRADLYSEALGVLLNWRREVDEPLDQREAVPQLEYIAYAMCDRGVQRLREDEIITLFEQMRAEYPNIHAVQKHAPEEFLRLLEWRTGILIEAGHVRHCGRLVPVFEFRHLTFQEYLAGLALVDGRFPGRDRSKSLAENVAPLAGRTSKIKNAFFGQVDIAVTENWREALRLCVASCNDDDVNHVLLTILNPMECENSVILARPRAVLAALCLADEPNISEESAHRVLQQFCGQINKYDPHFSSLVGRTTLNAAVMELIESDWLEEMHSFLVKEFCKRERKSRWFVSDVYGETIKKELPDDEAGFHQWVTDVVKHLTSSNEEEAIAACLTIKHLTSRMRRAVPELIEALCKRLTGNISLALAAANALGAIEDKQAVIPLIARLEDQNSEMRKAAAEALGTIKDGRAVEPLIARLEDVDSDVRRAAAEALGKIKDERAVEPLIALLEDADRSTRINALGALSFACQDERDRQLLYKDFATFYLFLDPQDEIDGLRIEEASIALEISPEEVFHRYEALAQRFHLKLSWRK